MLTPRFSISQIGGNSAYKFLDLPFSAREAALGGNQIAVKDDDINLTFHNPALISASMDNHFALSYVNYISDINYGYAAYGKKFDKIGNFVGGIQYVNYGKFTEADPTGLITGTFKAADYSCNIGYSRPIDSLFTVGATLKTIYSHLDQYVSVGSAVDFGGTYYNPHYLFTASAVVKGIGRQWKTYVDGNQEPLPFEIQLGVSKKLSKAPFRFSLIGTHLEKWDLTYEDPANPTPTTDPLTGAPIVQNKWKEFGDKLGRHVIG
ncbi:MAG: type IX secretion system protein PorQ, partial [Bacteroidia bacterium]|nr:type IX secretion system protein PorQ [Bacteroidia bacterium]